MNLQLFSQNSDNPTSLRDRIVQKTVEGLEQLKSEPASKRRQGGIRKWNKSVKAFAKSISIPQDDS